MDGGRSGEVVLLPPTWMTLMQLAAFESAAELVAWARRRRIERVEPVLTHEAGTPQIAFPASLLPTAAQRCHHEPAALLAREGRRLEARRARPTCLNPLERKRRPHPRGCGRLDSSSDADRCYLIRPSVCHFVVKYVTTSTGGAT